MTIFNGLITQIFLGTTVPIRHERACGRTLEMTAYFTKRNLVRDFLVNFFQDLNPRHS